MHSRGHSMGGKIAYELEKRMEREERQRNAFWCLEAVSQVFQNQIQSIIFRTTNLKKRSEDSKERQRRYWRTRSFWISFCLCFGLILQIDETYYDKELTVLHSPIEAFGGRKDREADEEAMKEWAQYTEMDFHCHMFEGGHFYIREQEEAVLSEVRKCLLGVPDEN